MGNSEGGHGRSPAHAGSGVGPTQRRLRIHRRKNLQTAAQPVFYDHDHDHDGERYQTCKPDVGTISDLPAFHLTASKLHMTKSRSKSQDADLNMIASGGPKPDVRRIAWSVRKKSETDSVSMCYFGHWILACSERWLAWGVCKKLFTYMCLCHQAV